MKRIIGLLLCLVLACGMLVSCGEKVIGGHAESLKEQFYIPPEKKISLKLYVVYDEADDGALKEVERRINALTEADYNTKLDVVYLKADEYDEKVDAAVAANEDAIVLVTSKAMMDKLYGDGEDIIITELYDEKQVTDKAPVLKVVTTYSASGSTVTKYGKDGKVVTGTEADDKKIPVSRQVSVGHLEDLSEYVLKTDAQYGLLNAKIAASLMDCAMFQYYALDKDGNIVKEEIADPNDENKKIFVDKMESGLFAIPNNRLIGGTNGYKYVQIDRQVCEIWLNHTKDELIAVDTAEEIAALRAEIVNELGYTAAQAEACVAEIDGNYATKATLEAGEKYILNVLEAPVVDEEETFKGAFAVLEGTDVERAMRIIYAINMDPALHNLLQYGIKDTNYTLDKATGTIATAITAEGKNYKMNPLYTGNLFSVHFSETHNWTAAVKEYAEAQNLAADKLYEDSKAPVTPAQ